MKAVSRLLFRGGGEPYKCSKECMKVLLGRGGARGRGGAEAGREGGGEEGPGESVMN